MKTQTRDPIEDLAEIDTAEIPSLLLRLAALHTALAARLAKNGHDPQNGTGPLEYVTIEEATARLKVPVDTIYRRWHRAPNAKKFGKQIRIPLSELHLLGEIPRENGHRPTGRLRSCAG